MDTTETRLALPGPDTKESSVTLAAAIIPNEKTEIALARADLARRYTAAIASAPHGRKVQARAAFIDTYNLGIWPALFALLGTVSAPTVERWAAVVRETGDALDLKDRRGGSRASSVTPDQQKILLSLYLHPNAPLLSEVIRRARRLMCAAGIPAPQSDDTFYRWLKKWTSENGAEATILREGSKAYNDKFAFYLTRDYSEIGAGEVLVADGHVCNFEILNPWTGKPKRMELVLWTDYKSESPLGWELMPTENTRAIASAFRRALLRTGRIPRVAYLDNGRAFGAKFFKGEDLSTQNGLYERLGMKVINAWPYHGQSKPIERFFRDFAEFERSVSSYTGTSIERKPPRLNRGETLHRRVYEKATQGYIPTMIEAHRAIAAWFDSWMDRTHEDGRLKGQTSRQVFDAELAASSLPVIDRAALDYLMLEAEIRTIHRDGIHLAGRRYFHPELHGRRHNVTVRYDLSDPAAIKVYDPDGKFLCEATETPSVHAMACLGTDSDRAELARQIEMKKGLEKQVGALAREFCEDEIIPATRAQLALVQEETPARAPLRALPERDVEQIEARAAAMTVETDEDRIWEQLPGLDEGEHYEALLRLEAAGRELPADERTFARFYEQSEHYTRHAARYQSLRISLLTAAQEAS
jgi:putative transposase